GEISTRLALGASRGRIGRQLLADSVLLALAGGLLGVALAPAAMRTLIAFLPRDTAANALSATVDARLALFALTVSVAAGLLSGFAPALHVGRTSLASSLRERSGGAGSDQQRQEISNSENATLTMHLYGSVTYVPTLLG